MSTINAVLLLGVAITPRGAAVLLGSRCAVYTSHAHTRVAATREPISLRISVSLTSKMYPRFSGLIASSPANSRLRYELCVQCKRHWSYKRVRRSANTYFVCLKHPSVSKNLNFFRVYALESPKARRAKNEVDLFAEGCSAIEDTPHPTPVCPVHQAEGSLFCFAPKRK